MAGEVIDLISSSPPPEPRSKPKINVTKTLSATRHAIDDLKGLEDEFDITGDIDGGGSYSQRPTDLRGSALRQSAAPGVEFLSDDFQSTGDLAEPILVESTGNGKRRRLSPSHKLLSSPRHASRQRAAASVDEFSDPFASSPPPSTNKVLKSGDMSMQRLKASSTGLCSLQTSGTVDDPGYSLGASVLPPSAQFEEPRARPSKPWSADGSNRPKDTSRKSSPDPFKSSQDLAVDEDREPSRPAASKKPEKHAKKSPSKVKPRPPVAREASSDPFVSSPGRKATSLAQDVTDLTQQDDEPIAKGYAPPSKPRAHAPDPRKSSPNPFASSSPPPTKKPKSTKPEHEIVSSPPLAPMAVSHARRQQWDPISSSAPEAAVINIDSESGSGNDSEDFPDMESLIKNPSQMPRSQLSRSRSDVLPKAKATTASKATKSRQPARTADERAREKARRQVDNEREKERKKEERARAKEAKTREKERAAALAEVNKMKTDKKVSTPEMIVDIPSSFNDGTRVQLDTLLEWLGVEFTTWDTADVVVKWRRKVTSKWNDDLGYWEPIPRRLMHENHVAVVMTAQEFVDLTLDDDRGIRSHIMSMEEKFSGCHIIYIIEGMMPWMKKNRNLRNRQFTSGVRSEAASTSRRRAPAQEYISEDLIEDSLLELQVMHDVLIHHTTIPLETAQWITVLTQHISTIPYKQQKSAAQGAGFCMESGQVKTGEDNKDTYVRLLQEIARVTQPIAYGITAEFPTVTQLVNGLGDGGPDRLKDVRKTVNREGALGDKTIGQAVSKRIHKVFTGRDEGSTDV